MKIEVGDFVELNNGEVHKVDRMTGNDPDYVDVAEHGPFVIDGKKYHKDGRFAFFGAGHLLSVKRIISRASDDIQSSQEGEPKLWRDMTDEAQSSYYSLAGWIAHNATPRGIELWNEFVERSGIKPEPVRETVTLEGNNTKSMGWVFGSIHPKDTTYRITFDLIDGEPDYSSIKMEKL